MLRLAVEKDMSGVRCACLVRIACVMGRGVCLSGGDQSVVMTDVCVVVVVRCVCVCVCLCVSAFVCVEWGGQSLAMTDGGGCVGDKD